MKHFTEFVHISNFKSIKDVVLEDCRRINLFIGKPNVGKSNILEALSLFSLPYLQYVGNGSIRRFIRVENDSELFFDGNIEEPACVETSAGEASVSASDKNLIVRLAYLLTEEVSFSFEDLMLLYTNNRIGIGSFNPFKSYFYSTDLQKEKTGTSFLLPPNGVNLMDVTARLSRLKLELTEIFQEYKLQYVFDNNSREIKIMKETKPGEIFLIPFHSIADTLQRMIFYKAAIESNHDSILIFEEPEAHAYPPYITKITQDIVSSTSNQFFITTHSPYVVNDLLESTGDELAIYLADYKENQTIVQRMTDKQMQEVYEFGADLFFNTETFLK